MLWSCYIYIISIGIIFIFYRSIQWYIIIKMWAMYLLSDVWCFLITIKISKETQHMPNHVTKWIPFKVNLVIVTINTFETFRYIIEMMIYKLRQWQNIFPVDLYFDRMLLTWKAHDCISRNCRHIKHNAVIFLFISMCKLSLD